jgi:hypothetical protein
VIAPFARPGKYWYYLRVAMTTSHLLALVIAIAAAIAACSGGPQTSQPAVPTSQTSPDPETTRLQTMAARFAPVDLTADVAALPAHERQALGKLVEAAKIFDALFLRQVWEGNESMLLDLLRDDSPVGRARLRYFLINKGPWSRLDEDEAFIPGAPEKPDAANFYPAGATKAEVEAWIKTLGPAERTRATGFFTTGDSSACPTASSTRVRWRAWRCCCARQPL